MYEEIIRILTSFFGNDYFYWDEVLLVPVDGQADVSLWAIVASPTGVIFVMDANEDWHEVSRDNEALIAILHERMKKIEKHYLKQSNS
jgi:hypothetical protein